MSLQLTSNRKRKIGENFTHRRLENENQNVIIRILCVVKWWLMGRGAENTSMTLAWCHKTVKQNQSHVELAGFRCAHSSTQMHPQRTQSGQTKSRAFWQKTNFKLWCNFKKTYKLLLFLIQYCFWGRCFFTIWAVYFLPVYKQPTASILRVFVRARDRRPWCSKTPNCYQCSSSLQQ